MYLQKTHLHLSSGKNTNNTLRQDLRKTKEMKNRIKKYMALLLCLCVAIGTIVTASGDQVDEAVFHGSDIPVVYVQGQGAELVVDNEDGSRTRVYPINLGSDKITALVEENIDVFAKAFFTQEWDEFCDVLYEIITDLYKDVALDENGEAPNGSHVYWGWDSNLGDRKNTYGKYDIQAYTFEYDWRKDPYQTADDLRLYIEAVRKATGANEVALLGRCLGACITSAYMDKYDAEYISDYIIYAGAHKGAALCSKIFCGEIYLESDGIERFVYDANLFGGDVYTDLLNSFVTMFNDMYGLEIACWAVNNVYKDIYLNIIPRVMVETFATFPGYWSMVTTEDYEKAKEVVFYGADPLKYKNFISIIDNYHYKVAKEMDADYQRYLDMGINIYNVTKYGYQAIPIAGEEENDTLSDLTVHVKHASMGATTARVPEQLPQDYVDKAVANGTDKYISLDREIDASTALVPDTTWFIKHMKHDNFPDSINRLFSAMLNIDGFDVNTLDIYPQYSVYSEELNDIVPMTEENMNTNEDWTVTFFDACQTFFNALYEIIVELIAQAQAPEAEQNI